VEVFRWNKEDRHWYLFDEETGTHCYLHKITAPEVPFIYTLVHALLEENGTWTLRATPFNNVYAALEYSEELLGYYPKFRDPQEDIFYATKEEK